YSIRTAAVSAGRAPGQAESQGESALVGLERGEHPATGEKIERARHVSPKAPFLTERQLPRPGHGQALRDIELRKSPLALAIVGVSRICQVADILGDGIGDQQGEPVGGPLFNLDLRGLVMRIPKGRRHSRDAGELRIRLEQLRLLYRRASQRAVGNDAE